MKGYGLPRNSDVESPDVADIHIYGLNTRSGRVDGRSYHRSAENKARARRIWKRAARRLNRELCNESD